MKENSTEIKTGRPNYCLKCWTEFTMLTPEEKENYDLMKAHIGAPRKTPEIDGHRGREIICNETGVRYISLTTCAKDIGVSTPSLSKHLAFRSPAKVKGLTFNYIY